MQEEYKFPITYDYWVLYNPLVPYIDYFCTKSQTGQPMKKQIIFFQNQGNLDY